MDKHDRRHERTKTAAAQRDPARSHTPPADHRPGQAQAHPAQEVAEGQDDPGLGDRIGIAVRDSPDTVGDHLHIAGRTNLRGGEDGEKERVRRDCKRREGGKA